MSRWHYYIESKSRMKITTEKGSKKDIEIKNVVTIRENKHMLTISNKPTRKVVMESIIALLVYFIFLINFRCLSSDNLYKYKTLILRTNLDLAK